MGATISAPYFACAAAMMACLCVTSNSGASLVDSVSHRRFCRSFPVCWRDKSALSNAVCCWHSARMALSKCSRIRLFDCTTNSLRRAGVGEETKDEARITRSRGRRLVRSQKRMRSKFRKVSPSPLSTPSRNLSTRKGSRARRWVSCTRRRNVRDVDGSKGVGVAVEERRGCEWIMSLRMKCKYVFMPCCSDNCVPNSLSQ